MPIFTQNVINTLSNMALAQLTYDKRLIQKTRLDQYGDSLLNVSFTFQAIYQPFSIQKVSEKLESKSMEGHMGLN